MKINLEFDQIELDAFSGVSDTIQSAGNNDIVLMACSSKEQLDALIKNNLSKEFKGLIISPFQPKKEVDCLVLDKERMKNLEKKLIDYYYPIVEGIKYIGVTGTNGKTSVCWIFSEISKKQGKKVLYMGTPGVFLNGNRVDEKILTTTPSYLSLRRITYRFKGSFDAVALEVSSHALEQNRLKGTKLDAGAWTNFSQDHLDYHKSMKSYLEAKKKIFEITKDNKIIVPVQNKELQNLLTEESTILSSDVKDLEVEVSEIFSHGFTKLNLEVALSLFQMIFGKIKTSLNLKNISLPPGRFQIIKKRGTFFILDYAHTSDALKNLLNQVQKIFPERKIITVFGCGGNRDKTKRPLMGKVAENNSDLVILTSDNPRDEDPMDIIEDIKKGFMVPPEYEVDRRLAIKKAFKKANENYVIVVAGKGHEDYQEIKGVRYKLSDLEIIGEFE